ncbi:DoxX family membrane protein [Antribacter gilvus]|uniref:DoxX family membrane protein n=1 Tax=Antribacter gilvus TaxID=2304675 RepID=UPI000F7A2BF8|nr:DoxX family membrane protein [Antribacter gilvus]
MLLRHMARPMLASWYVYDGVQAARNPHEHVRAAREGSDLVTQALGGPPLSEKQVVAAVRVHGAATAFFGLLLGLGKAPRLSAVALALLTVPLAVVNQPFTAPKHERTARTERFARNLGAIGAALIAGADLEGRPGVSWRVANARATRAAARSAKDAQKAVKGALKGD